MKKEVIIKEGVTISQQGHSVSIRGPKGELKREFKHPKVKISVKDNNLVINSETDRRKIGSTIGTWAAHLKNMMIGVTDGWEAKMKIVYQHFPVKIKIEGNSVIIQNFLGERKDRKAKIMGDTKVDTKKDELIITGIDKESVGQTCGNIELVAKVRGKDRRVFSDGIFITSKPKPVEEKK